MGSMTIVVECIILTWHEVLAVHDAAACAWRILPPGPGESQRRGLTCGKLVPRRCAQVRYGLKTAVDDGDSDVCAEVAVRPHRGRVDGLGGVFGGRDGDCF